jgi:cytochrome c-type biogenesis protein
MKESSRLGRLPIFSAKWVFQGSIFDRTLSERFYFEEHVMDAVFSAIQHWVSSGSMWPAMAGAFIGGVMTAMSPCIIAMIPLLIGYIAGVEGEVTTLRSFVFTLVFILGFSLELALLFTVGFAAAPFLQSEYTVYVLAALCIVLGLHFLELFRIPFSVSQDRIPKIAGLTGAAVFGFMFGLVSLPCTGPALLLIVSVIPVKGFFVGGMMMLLYGLGHCLLILVIGTSAGIAGRLLGSRQLNTATFCAKQAGGVLLTLVGLYIGLGAIFPGIAPGI